MLLSNKHFYSHVYECFRLIFIHSKRQKLDHCRREATDAHCYKLRTSMAFNHRDAVKQEGLVQAGVCPDGILTCEKSSAALYTMCSFVSAPLVLLLYSNIDNSTKNAATWSGSEPSLVASVGGFMYLIPNQSWTAGSNRESVSQ